MADPLSLLRQYYVNKKEIVEKNDMICFGEYCWPKTVKTNYLAYDSSLDGPNKEYYTLECVLFFMKNADLRYRAYVKHAAKEEIPVVRRRDRKELLAYMCGETTTGSSIDKSAAIELPKPCSDSNAGASSTAVLLFNSMSAPNDGKRLAKKRSSIIDADTDLDGGQSGTSGSSEKRRVMSGKNFEEHPSFEQTKSKSALTKAENELKDKSDGKPELESGYNLFCTILFKYLMDVPINERMSVIENRWNQLPDNHREIYERRAMSEYLVKCKPYMISSTERERHKVLGENKFKLPSEIKLKQSQNLPKQESKAPEPMVETRDKEYAALMCYQTERLSAVQEKCHNRGNLDVMTMIIQEWTEKLSDKKKAKYYKMTESLAPILPTVSKTIGNDNTLTASESVNADEKKTMSTAFKNQPKRPPKSGYALFTSEQLSELTTEIARRWNSEISESEKEKYDTRAKEMVAIYERNLEQFKNALTQQYLSLNEKTKHKGKGKAKSSNAEGDPVVDDSNVIETIDVSTTGDRVNNSSDESEFESENEEQNEEQKECSENEGSVGEEGEEGEEDAEGSESDQ